MLPLITEFLMLSDEPALLARGGRIQQVNSSAEALLGCACAGKTVRELFGEEIAGSQAPNFVAGVFLQGQMQTVRVSRVEGMQVFFISRGEQDLAVMNDASLSMLRSSIMVLGLAADRGRQRVEELGDKVLDGCFMGVTKQYYALNRLVANAGVVYSVLRGELTAVFSAMDLAMLCRSMAESFSLLCPSPILRVNAPASVLMQGDERLLETMLLNLVSNCLLHAKGLSTVSISLAETERSVILSVSDDGCGIPPEQLPSVFNRYRFGCTAPGLTNGAGLGLSVVRAAAGRHGGTLLLESREGHGTSVRVSLARMSGAPRLRSDRKETRCEMSSLLTGLSGCLPDECYEARYLD